VIASKRLLADGLTAFTDGDALLGAIGDEEYRAAARAYMEKTFKKRG
jgi:hypothetical protein